jgi:hypothetical protein
MYRKKPGKIALTRIVANFAGPRVFCIDRGFHPALASILLAKSPKFDDRVTSLPSTRIAVTRST